jgi:hypothetical protein
MIIPSSSSSTSKKQIIIQAVFGKNLGRLRSFIEKRNKRKRKKDCMNKNRREVLEKLYNPSTTQRNYEFCYIQFVNFLVREDHTETGWCSKEQHQYTLNFLIEFQSLVCQNLQQ